jgi:small subunit ribosomal protein S19
MSRSSWKGPYIDTQLRDDLLSGKSRLSFKELEKLLNSNVVLDEGKEQNIADSYGREVSALDSLSQKPETATPASSPSEELLSAPKVSPTPKKTKPLKNKGKLSKKKGKAALAVAKKKGTGRKKKGLSKEHKISAKEFKRKARSEGQKPKTYGKGPFRSTSRSSTIIPEFIGSTVMVHNGKDFSRLSISESIVGHKIGEFAITRRVRHNLNRNKSKLSIRKKISGTGGGHGRITLNRINDWSIDAS